MSFMVNKNLLIFFILICLSAVDCSDSVTEPVILGYLEVSVFARDSIKIEYDNNVIYEGYINCEKNACLKKIIESAKVGVHEIKFTDLSSLNFYNNKFYLEYTTKIEIVYYTPDNSSEKIYEFRTHNLTLYDSNIERRENL